MKKLIPVLILSFLFLSDQYAQKKTTGPMAAPCLSGFLAADQWVSVLHTDNCDLENLSGYGSIVIDPEGNRHLIYFNNIKVVQDGAQYYLRGGSLLAKADSVAPIKLHPEDAHNDTAIFFADSIKLTRYDYLVKGRVNYFIKNPIDSLISDTITTQSSWMSRGANDYDLLGKIYLGDSAGYSLSKEYTSSVSFSDGGYFIIRWGNGYYFSANTKLKLGERTIDLGSPRKFQYFSIPGSELRIKNYCKILCDTIILDASLTRSPDTLKKSWYGYYYKNPKIEFNQLFTGTVDRSFSVFLDSMLHFNSFDSPFRFANSLQMDSVYFRGYAANIDTLSISLPDTDSSCFVHGNMHIPYIADTTLKPFTLYESEDFKLDIEVKDFFWGDWGSNDILSMGVYIGDSLWHFKIDENQRTPLLKFLIPPDIAFDTTQLKVYFTTNGVEVYNKQQNMVRDQTVLNLLTENQIFVKSAIGNPKMYYIQIADPTFLAQPSISELKIFPSPFTEKITIDFDNYENINEPLSVIITSLDGREVYNENINTLPSTFHLTDLNSGIYILRIQTENMLIATKKIIKNQ